MRTLQGTEVSQCVKNRHLPIDSPGQDRLTLQGVDILGYRSALRLRLVPQLNRGILSYFINTNQF